MDICAICNEHLSNGLDVVTLREKGARGVNSASASRQSNITVFENQVVHVQCRKEFCNPNLIFKSNKVCNKDNSSQSAATPTLRSVGGKFDFKTHCFFCSTIVETATQSRGRTSKKHPVRTKVFDKSILNICKERSDDWANGVKRRLNHAIDLHASDTIYHQVCSVNFRTGKNIPLQFRSLNCKSDDSNKSGRPKDKTKEDAFLKTMAYIEGNDEELFTVGDLVKHMEICLENTDCEAYTTRYMKDKIEAHFGNNVIISEICGKADVVTLRPTVSLILNEFHKSQCDDTVEEKIKIIKTAAKLIKTDIKSISSQGDMYPTSAEIAVIDECLAFIPESLRTFLNEIMSAKCETTKVKLASIGHAIVQAARPRGILAPLQLGLAVQMHHHFASRFLIDSLNRHGFCCSYDETKKFERSAAVSKGTDIPGYIPGRFVQYVADNADHNVRTLSGSGTFHGMAIIATITPKLRTENIISRRTVTTEDIVNAGRLRIDFYKSQQEMALSYKEIRQVQAQDHTSNFDYVWKVSCLLKSPRPNWSGTMQTAHNSGDYPGQSSMVFLPMIDMNPGDMSCIYSTLLFISDHARKHNVTPIVTFDQPLWWKSLTIILSSSETSVLRNIVLRLGGFHTEMSFLGCIGHLMAGSGIEELLETVYASNTIEHMLSGKAVARAVRGHLLVDAALNTVLARQIFGTEFHMEGNDDVMDVEDNDIIEARILYERLMTGGERAEIINNSEVLTRIKERMDCFKDRFIGFRTAKLWFQYMKMVDILKTFLKAERTGNWHLHLQAVSDMLPFFAASGHNMYAKSARIYLQMMTELEETHPDVYHSFVNGFHVVRRSDRYWSGLSTDLIIEQCFMKSLKSTGGLTRGKGMTEIQRLIFVMGMPVFAEFNSAMMEVTGVSHITSEQHVDVLKSRTVRDSEDTNLMIQFLDNMSPFDIDGISDLHSISSGLTAGSHVNADTAENVGKTILDDMTGTNVLLYTFRRKNQVTTLSSKTMKVGKRNVQIDPYLAFQRLITTAETKEHEMSYYFKYELTIYPPALFETSGLPRQANKPVLAESIWTATKSDTHKITIPHTCQFVIDGGYLLHRLPWPRQATYDNILASYVSYVTKHYGYAIIVFDGYNESVSTKDMAHLRRLEGSIGATVEFEVNMTVPLKKAQFLSNPINKQRFIDMLSERLIIGGCIVHNAKSDADLMIVQKAVECSTTHPTVVIGEDTDLLVLLLHHSFPDADIYFRSEPKPNQRVPKVWSIQYAKMMLGFETCRHILFSHAFLGCDTTSRIFGLGKGAILKHLQSEDSYLRDQASVFSLPPNEVSCDNIVDAGERALVFLYSGKKNMNVNDLRYQMFCDKVGSRYSHVKPETLPPTQAATRQHSKRVYHQVQQWKGVDLNPEFWGWTIKDNKLYPVDTDLPPAPEELLHAIMCSCKTDCETLRCSCRKHGMNCSTACKECRGVCCTNSPQPDLDDDADDTGEM